MQHLVWTIIQMTHGFDLSKCLLIQSIQKDELHGSINSGKNCDTVLGTDIWLHWVSCLSVNGVYELWWYPAINRILCYLKSGFFLAVYSSKTADMVQAIFTRIVYLHVFLVLRRELMIRVFELLLRPGSRAVPGPKSSCIGAIASRGPRWTKRSVTHCYQPLQWSPLQAEEDTMRLEAYLILY